MSVGDPSAAAVFTEADLERFDAQKSSARLGNGERLAYVDMGARRAPPLILIHGYTDSARDWAPLVPFLGSRLRLIIVDLRGHGASSKPECCYALPDFADDIRLLLKRLGVTHAHVAGHSLGSLVALTFAATWPEKTDRLILVSSTGTSFVTHSSGASDWLAEIGDLKDPIDANSVFMRDWWQQSILINPEFFSGRQRHDAAAIPARVWRAIADQSLTGVILSPMLSRIGAKTLLIWGGTDTLVDATGRDALRTGIKGAEVRMFDSLGHDLIWQDPEAVAKVIIDFLVAK